MEIVLKYFSEFTETQLQQLQSLRGLYQDWNEKINVISRKDIDSLYEKHVLHSWLLRQHSVSMTAPKLWTLVAAAGSWHSIGPVLSPGALSYG
ncbi:hypothetical protein LWM68_31950 [Niabella sp. W65]|nr:hypothetical protein [Niabella sp. W65]MCH7366974.1 hypothetical protein [Niabella sp. W65]